MCLQFREWVVCKVYKLRNNEAYHPNAVQQQQPMIPLAPPEAIQPNEDQRELVPYDQFSDDERTMISVDIIERVLGFPLYPQLEDYESNTTTVSP